jgi:hypothetical protein
MNNYNHPIIDNRGPSWLKRLAIVFLLLGFIAFGFLVLEKLDVINVIDNKTSSVDQNNAAVDNSTSSVTFKEVESSSLGNVPANTNISNEPNTTNSGTDSIQKTDSEFEGTNNVSNSSVSALITSTRYSSDTSSYLVKVQVSGATSGTCKASISKADAIFYSNSEISLLTGSTYACSDIKFNSTDLFSGGTWKIVLNIDTPNGSTTVTKEVTL